MGRNKIKIQKIDNERIRQVTFYKRKRGLIKKSMELSLLCEVKVLLCVVDKNEKLVVYCSDGMTSDVMQNSLCNDNFQKEYLTNDDYKDLFSESLNMDDNDEGSRRIERLKEKDLKEEEEKFDLSEIQKKKEIGTIINSFKVDNRIEIKKGNECMDIRSQNKLNSSTVRKSLNNCFDKISSKFINSSETSNTKKDKLQIQTSPMEMPNLKLISKDLGQIRANISDNFHNFSQNEQQILNKLGGFGNDFGSLGAIDNNIINYNMPNIHIIQKSQSGFNNKSDMTPLNSLGLNLNNKSNNNNDAFKNIIANFNMITNNNSSRSIGLGLPSSSSLQNDMNNQIFLQNLFNQNYMNMNATNTSNNFNFPLNQLIGINNSNTNQINGKFSSGSTSNFENELLKKRMRENLLVNNMNSLNNVNNKPGDGSGWSNRNQVNDLGGNTQNVNIANAQNILYNYIQANNIPYNTSSGFVNEKKQI